MRSEIRELSGKIEELEYLTRGKTAQIERTLQKFSTRVPPPIGVPEDLLNRDEEWIRRKSGKDVEIFSQGLRLLRTGGFEEANAEFKRFSQLYVDSSFADNALFWSGICYEKLGDYDRAIVSFSEVFQRYPAENRVTVSLYRMGEVFEKIGEKENARTAFQKLIDDYPKDPYAREAANRLKRLR